MSAAREGNEDAVAVYLLFFPLNAYYIDRKGTHGAIKM
jgi:hypothetical protein